MKKTSSSYWSTYIQRPESLYQTRAIRFLDESRDQFLKALRFQNRIHILEVGCGPGAYCHVLERWLPDSYLTGIDRDPVFIEYARNKSAALKSKCQFMVGDVTKLEFPDNTFDATTSHTVVEHVETDAFLREQYRVLKPGGIITVLSVRSQLPYHYESGKGIPVEEKAFRDKLEPYFKAVDKKYGVAQYAVTETELAQHMAKAGLKDISFDFLVQTIIPDNAGVSPALARAMIDAERQVDLDGVSLAKTIAPNILSEAEIERFTLLVNSRFDQRLQSYVAGQKIWDISVSLILVARGYK